MVLEGVLSQALWVPVGPCLGGGDLARAWYFGYSLGCYRATCTGLAALALQATQAPLQACAPPLLDSWVGEVLQLHAKCFPQFSG